MILRLRRLLLPTTRVPPLARVYRWLYAQSLRLVVADLRREPAIKAIVMRSAFDGPWFRPLVSDIDLLIVCRDDESAKSCGQRIQRRLTVWKKLLPHFKGGWICGEAQMLEGENDVVLNYVLLDDAVTVYGAFDREALRELYRPGESIARYVKAAWWYAEEVNRLLHLPLEVRRERSCDKVMAKVLVYAGHGCDESRVAVQALFGGIGAAAAVESVEAAFLPFLRLLKERLRELPFVRRPDAFVFRAGDGPRPLCRSDVRPLADEAMRRSVERFRSFVEAAVPCPELRTYRTRDGADATITFAVFREEDMQAETLRSFARAWRRVTLADPAAASHLAGVLPQPIVVDEEMLRVCLVLNVLECHRTWREFVKLEPAPPERSPRGPSVAAALVEPGAAS